IDFNLPAGSSVVTLTGPILPPLNAGHGGALGANSNSLTIGPSAPGTLVIDGGGRGTGSFMAYSGAVTIGNRTRFNALARGGDGGDGGGGGGRGGGRSAGIGMRGGGGGGGYGGGGGAGGVNEGAGGIGGEYGGGGRGGGIGLGGRGGFGGGGGSATDGTGGNG